MKEFSFNSLRAEYPELGLNSAFFELDLHRLNVRNRLDQGLYMDSIVVKAPLQGEYLAAISPGDKIPSHGTDAWGMTYAYDFIQVKKNKNDALTWHSKALADYFLGRVKLSDTFGWGQPIYSPIDGVVREVFNSVKERNRLHIVSDVGYAIYNEMFFSFKRGQIHKLGGNYLIIEGESCCVFIAHAKTGSIIPKVGDRLVAGQKIGAVGHSGNSTAPHLHIQLMDRVDLRFAQGLPCCFDSYEVLRDGVWEPVRNSIPTRSELVRFTA